MACPTTTLRCKPANSTIVRETLQYIALAAAPEKTTRKQQQKKETVAVLEYCSTVNSTCATVAALEAGTAHILYIKM